MPPGLSDDDRRRLERERERVAARLAAGREKTGIRMAAERRRIEKLRGREPIEITGPDGVRVRLSMSRSGLVLLPGSDTGTVLDLFMWVAALAWDLVAVLVHLLVFRRGWTVDVDAAPRARFGLRLRSADAAAARMREIADAVRLDGMAALDRWRRR